MIRKLRYTLLGVLLIHCSYVFSQNKWQQEVNYKIDVTLNDEDHILNGLIRLEYINNSPHSLDSIYFHLWPNAYRDQNSAFAKQQLEDGHTEFYFSSEEDKGYIDSLDFSVNDQPAKFSFTKDHQDICILYLNKSLKSGDTAIITTPFRVKIPKTFSRLGHQGESYQISQWYPKPAVFDHKGWHPMPYLNLGEYFSEFGRYEVSITLPENYVVAATGDLQNEDELEKLFELDSITRSKYHIDDESDEGVLIPGFKGMDKKIFPESSLQTKKLTYIQENVHDFAWFADKRYNVLTESFSLPGSGKNVQSFVFFTDYNGDLWKNALKYVTEATKFYSAKIGDYEYNQVSAVEGSLVAGSGMEYPTITVIGDVTTSTELETIVVHEVGHNWFYGMLGSHERLHPWMDEGINSYYENLFFKTHYPNRSLIPGGINSGLARYFGLADISYSELLDYIARSVARENLDQPIGSSAPELTEINTGLIVYGKAALAFNYLMHYLGEDGFNEIMQDYFIQWKFRHPYPEDVVDVFQKYVQDDLSWFFDDIINTTKKVDYKIKSVEKEGLGYSIRLKNTGQIAAPIPVSAVKNHEILQTIWVSGFDEDTIIQMTLSAEPDYFRIDEEEITLDFDRANNTWYTRSFSKIEPLRLQLFGSLENTYKNEIFLTPVIGWNNYDKFMAGAAIYNTLLPRKNIELTMLPLYDFRTNSLVGMGDVTFNIFPGKGFLQKIDFGLAVKSFHYDDFKFEQRYFKWQPFLKGTLRKQDLRSSKQSVIRLRRVMVEQDEVRSQGPYLLEFKKIQENYYIDELEYQFQNKRSINPFNFTVTAQHYEDFVKTSLLANYQISLKKKDIFLLFFAGVFSKDPDLSYRFEYNVSAITGSRDYMYDHLYFGRSEFEGFWYQQVHVADGGLKIRTDKFPFGRTDDWIASFNVEVPLPKFPIYIYAEAATTGEVWAQKFNTEKILWDMGISLTLPKDIFEIYFPILMSEDLKQAFHANGKNYFQRITFMINLDRMNPIERIRNIKL